MLKAELVKKLGDFLNKYESLLGKPATKEEIKKTKSILNIKFPEDYVDFIIRFGGFFGIHAFNNGSLIGRETVIEITQWLRQIYSIGDPRYKEARNNIAISDAGTGIRL